MSGESSFLCCCFSFRLFSSLLLRPRFLSSQVECLLAGDSPLVFFLFPGGRADPRRRVEGKRCSGSGRSVPASCEQDFERMGTVDRSGHVLQYPRDEFRDPRAHARQVRLCATDAPGDDARQKVAAIFASHLQRSPRVSLRVR